jgi:hypothetical protein
MEKRPEWNGVHVTLKEYVDLRFIEMQRAVDKAEASMAYRLQGMNEFRETIQDIQSKSIPRTEYDVAHKQIEKEIKILQASASEAKGKASATAMFIVAGIALASLLINVIQLLAGK